MPQFDHTNRGRLFKNQNKAQESHSDYSGHLNVNGEEMYIDAWLKEGPKGKFMSLSVKPKTVKQQSAPAKNTNNFDDDIPF